MFALTLMVYLDRNTSERVESIYQYVLTKEEQTRKELNELKDVVHTVDNHVTQNATKIENLQESVAELKTQVMENEKSLHRIEVEIQKLNGTNPGDANAQASVE